MRVSRDRELAASTCFELGPERRCAVVLVEAPMMRRSLLKRFHEVRIESGVPQASIVR